MCSHSPLFCTVSQLDLSRNAICGRKPWGMGIYNVEGIKAVADALRVAGSLTRADVRSNRLDNAAKEQLRVSVQDREGLELLL